MKALLVFIVVLLLGRAFLWHRRRRWNLIAKPIFEILMERESVDLQTLHALVYERIGEGYQKHYPPEIYGQMASYTHVGSVIRVLLLTEHLKLVEAFQTTDQARWGKYKIISLTELGKKEAELIKAT